MFNNKAASIRGFVIFLHIKYIKPFLQFNANSPILRQYHMDITEFDIEFLALKLSENPQSPLFARLADLYLEKGQTVEALHLCEEGVRLFPDYYAGHLVLGKIHLALQEYSKARAALHRALELSPFNQVAQLLLSSLPAQPDESVRTTDETYFAPVQEQTAEVEVQPSADIPEQTVEPPYESMSAEEISFPQPVVESTPISPSSEQGFVTFDEYVAQHASELPTQPSTTLDEYLGDSPPIQQTQEPMIEELPTAEQETSPIEPLAQQSEPEIIFTSPEQAQLFAEMMGEEAAQQEPQQTAPSIDELAEKLQNAERIVPAEDYQPTPLPETVENENTMGMVTPTLAEIYASQGEYNAAIQAYEILVFSQPAKAAEFQKRIQELQRLQMEKEGLV